MFEDKELADEAVAAVEKQIHHDHDHDKGHTTVVERTV